MKFLGRFLLLCVIAPAVFLSACARDAGGRITVGISIPTQREERWVRDVEQFRKDAARGIDIKLQISDNDAARQLAQCENLIAQGIDVLILAPHDAPAASVIVEKAHRAGIPVISYDRLITNAAVDLYISFDNEKVGEIQARYLTRLVPKGKYIVLAGAPTDNNAKLFHKGAMNIIGPLAAKGDIQIVMDQPVRDWQPSEAMKLVENALTSAANKIDGILAPNDGTAGGAIQALAAQGLAGKVPVTGQDAELSAAMRIVEGTQFMTVFKDTRKLATAAMSAAEKLARKSAPATNAKVPNGLMDVPANLLEPIAVDKTNIDDLLINSGYLSRAQVYRKYS
ncbi:MAG: substrate-binding domain-containing protein [Elusimicrobiaceae bacterium]|jgi:D-xylose transport system substrate-binding protein